MKVKNKLTRLATVTLSPLLFTLNPVKATSYQDDITNDPLLDLSIQAQVPQSEFSVMKNHVYPIHLKMQVQSSAR